MHTGSVRSSSIKEIQFCRPFLTGGNRKGSEGKKTCTVACYKLQKCTLRNFSTKKYSQKIKIFQAVWSSNCNKIKLSLLFNKTKILFINIVKWERVEIKIPYISIFYTHINWNRILSQSDRVLAFKCFIYKPLKYWNK